MQHVHERSKAVVLTSLLVLVPGAGLADPGWRANFGLLSIDVNGEKSFGRPNGKTVSTDIDGAAGFEIAVERSVGRRWGATFSYIGGSAHSVSIRQDFPDSTSFESSDEFSFTSISFGLQYDLVPDKDWHLHVEPYLAYVVFDDVYLESAGPPYDQQAPLDLDIDNPLLAGLALSFESPFSDSRWNWYAKARLLLATFEGETYPNPDFPGESSSIELDFNSLMLGVGIGYTF
jgi:hypothetical protein